MTTGPGGDAAPAPRARRERRPAPAWEPAALAALARWVPPPPATTLGRLAGYAWAAPLSIAGLAAGLGARTRPQVRAGVLVFPHARGVTGALLSRRGYAAAAIGHVVVARAAPGAALLAHELVHVRHAERLGPLLAPAYLGLMAVYGYRRHPMERAARAGAARVAGEAGGR